VPYVRRVALTAALAVSAGLLAACSGSAPSQANAVAADVRAGNLGTARSAWLPAHLTYERLGAAYDSFGSFDDAIDGRPDGFAGGVSSPQLSVSSRGQADSACGQVLEELAPIAAMTEPRIS
jgi:hypothetical protein